MKKAFLITALLAFLYPCFLSALEQNEATEAQKARVIADKAEIFLEASQHSIVIDTIPRGTVVTLFQSGGKNKKWLYISYLSEKRSSKVTGFIAGNRVEIVGEGKTEHPADEQKPAPVEKETQEGQEENEERQAQEEEKEETLNQELEQKEQEGEKQIIPEILLQEKAETQQEQDQESGQSGEKQREEEQALEKGEKENIPQKLEEEKAENETIEQEKLQAEEEEAVEEPQQPEEELPKVLTKVSVKVPRANIRLMPTTKSAIISQAVSGVELKTLAKTGNWYRVNLAPNKEGLVLSGYIHHNIVNEIFETAVPPPPEPEKIIEKEPEPVEEVAEPEPEHKLEMPTPRKRNIGDYFWVGGGAGYTVPSESYLKNGMNIGGTFGFGVMRNLAIELRVPYSQGDVIGTAGGLSSGRLSSLSLMLSVQARYPIKKRYVPYVVAGGDYHLNTFSLNEEITNSWKDLGFNIEERVDHTFGFHFGAGLDYFLLENIALNLDVRYYTATLTGKRTLANQTSQETTSGPIGNMKLNSIQAGISVKLYLNPLKRK